MKPKLSICIPTYNRAQTLRETIDSILPQILGNFNIEILISDNASTDDTPSIVCEYQLQNRSIISFTHTEKIRLRKIEAEEIEEAVREGTIIEAYPDDSRGASCLILGFTNKGRPLPR
jgi:glycosyltransferase involved in cell wall biosynthesis